MIKKIETSSGTHLQGYLEATYEELIEKLGKPHIKNHLGNDVTTEWRFEIKSQTIVIYDWKEHRQREDIPLWNIGGTSDKVFKIIKKLFPKNNVKTITETHTEFAERYLYR